jgi:hypothetical protein
MDLGCFYSHRTKQALNEVSDSEQGHHARIKRKSSIVSLILIKIKTSSNVVLLESSKEGTTTILESLLIVCCFVTGVI